MKRVLLWSTLLLCLTAFAGCGNAGDNSAAASTTTEGVAATAAQTEAAEETSAETQTETEKETQTETEKETQTETEKETVEVIDVVEDGMVPVYGSSLKDGEYDVKVSSSSSMFQIESARLTVDNGEMSAVLTMGGTGYLYLFMGSSEDAEQAAEEERIPFEENEAGQYTFTVPVEALDMGLDCAAYSKRKELWYDRTILFRVDSLPVDAFAEGFVKDADSLTLEDGEYTIEVTLEGGSGKASVQSPAKLTVTDGEPVAEIIWSSNKYDYMVVNGEHFDPVSIEEYSVFEIPVLGFDYKMPVSADTTAMSTPHEIEYTLYFDSSTIR